MKYQLLIIAILAMFLNGCTSNPPTKNGVDKDSNAVPKTTRARIFSQKEKNGSETGVYMQNLELRNGVKVNGKSVEGKRKIELSANSSFAGKTPNCESGQNGLTILHEKPVAKGWQFPAKLDVSWTVDGKVIKPTKIIGSPIEKEDGEWWESAITAIDCETYKQISTATKIELTVGNAIIGLQDEEVAALKEFARALGH